MNAIPDPRLVALERSIASHEPMPRDPQARREQALRASARFQDRYGEPAADVATLEHTVEVPGHPAARLRVLWPTAERPGPAAPGAGLPIYLTLFGGGWTIGSIDDAAYHATGTRLAAESGCIVVLGHYSHAPEVQYPAQPEQAYALLRWCVDHALELGGDPERVAIGGASAGANLATVATIMNRDRGHAPIRMQILEVPSADLTMRHLDTRGLAPKDLLLARPLIRYLVRQYIPDRRRRGEPYASPLRADLRGLPEALILTAEVDALRGDGEAYARALMAAGVPTVCLRAIGQSHVGGGHRRFVPASAAAQRLILDAVRSLHEPPREWPTVEEWVALHRPSA